jgi:hypothetical protein
MLVATLIFGFNNSGPGRKASGNMKFNWEVSKI